MIFQILSPLTTSIEGDSLKEAIKNFTKINYASQFNNLVIADQSNNRYQANIKYYNMYNRNKIGISINRASDNVGLNTYPNSILQPILQETDNGKINEVGFGLNIHPYGSGSAPDPFNLNVNPFGLGINPYGLGINQNSIKATPIITAPNMISASNIGPVVAAPVVAMPNYSIMAKLGFF